MICRQFNISHEDSGFLLQLKQKNFLAISCLCFNFNLISSFLVLVSSISLLISTVSNLSFSIFSFFFSCVKGHFKPTLQYCSLGHLNNFP